jgi:hypothetical protein
MDYSRRKLLLGSLAAPFIWGTSTAKALPSLGGLKLPQMPGLGSLTEGKLPISTNIKDAIYGDAAKDNFRSGRVAALSTLPRDPNGGFVLAAGYYQMTAQSYCLHAGTHGPGGGDGYLYAPVKGAATEAVIAILQNSLAHLDIAQHDIQMLLWAIVSRAKFEDLNNQLKIVAGRLLTQKQLAALNRNALSVLTSPAMSRAMGGAPPFLRQVFQAEADMRRLVSAPSLAYADMERVAVLAGAAPLGEGSVETPSGRWSLHPDGYWVRYIPSGYSTTLVQIWVAAGSAAVGRVCDLATHIAVPGNTSRQRLAQSARIKTGG